MPACRCSPAGVPPGLGADTWSRGHGNCSYLHVYNCSPYILSFMEVTVFALFWPSHTRIKRRNPPLDITCRNHLNVPCGLTAQWQCIHRAEIREHWWWCAGAGQEEASEPASAQRGADLDKAQTGVQNLPGPAQRWQLGSHQAHHQICTAHLL